MAGCCAGMILYGAYFLAISYPRPFPLREGGRHHSIAMGVIRETEHQLCVCVLCRTLPGCGCRWRLLLLLPPVRHQGKPAFPITGSSARYCLSFPLCPPQAPHNSPSSMPRVVPPITSPLLLEIQVILQEFCVVCASFHACNFLMVLS